MKVIEFANIEEYSVSEIAKHNDVISIVKSSHDKTRYCADFITTCKRWQTAVHRFFKALEGDTRFGGWQDAIVECCENGYFHMDEMESKYQGGWHWEVEPLDEDTYYIELTISV